MILAGLAIALLAAVIVATWQVHRLEAATDRLERATARLRATTNGDPGTPRPHR